MKINSQKTDLSTNTQIIPLNVSKLNTIKTEEKKTKLSTLFKRHTLNMKVKG